MYVITAATSTQLSVVIRRSQSGAGCYIGNQCSRRGVEWHRYGRFAVDELAAMRALYACMQVADARHQKRLQRHSLPGKWRCFAKPVALKAARSFPSHPA